MRALLTSVALGFVVMATPVLAADWQEIVVPLTINGIDVGEVTARISEGDVAVLAADLQKGGFDSAAWLRLSVLSDLRVSPPATTDTYVSLKAARPWVMYKFDEAALTLSIDVDPHLLTRTAVALRSNRPAGLYYSNDRSSFLNYSLTSANLRSPSAFLEGGASIRRDLFYSSFSHDPGGSAIVRQLTSYIHDDRSALRRWTFGDATASSADPLGGGALIGGVTVSRAYSIDPYFVRYPSLGLSGIATTPSRVDVYVNGFLVDSRQVPPGPFQLNDVPVSGGAGITQYVIRDAFGRETTETSNFYYSTAVLAKGISEYTYSAGALRGAFGEQNFKYGAPALLAFHRVGVTDRITLGGRAEASRGLWSVGPLASFGTRLGDFGAGFAASGDHGRRGAAVQLSYQYLYSKFSIGAALRGETRDYANLSTPYDVNKLVRDINVFASRAIGRVALQLQVAQQQTRDDQKSSRAGLFASMPVTTRASAFATAGITRVAGHSSGQYSFGLSFLIGSETNTNLTIDHTQGQTTSSVALQKTLPQGTGYGYRLQGQQVTGTSATSGGEIDYQNDWGRIGSFFDPLHTNQRPTLSIASGVVHQSGVWIPTRSVADSYALVEVPDVSGVRVYLNNQLVGRTDSRGDLLVPNLLSYYGNRIRIDDRDIPLDYDIQGVEKVVAPPYRSGATVRFPVTRIQSVTGTVVIVRAGGEVVPAFGDLTLRGGGKNVSSPIGRNGEFYFENVLPGRYNATIDSNDGQCVFALNVPKSAESQLTLGRLRCSTP